MNIYAGEGAAKLFLSPIRDRRIYARRRNHFAHVGVIPTVFGGRGSGREKESKANPLQKHWELGAIKQCRIYTKWFRSPHFPFLKWENKNCHLTFVDDNIATVKFISRLAVNNMVSKLLMAYILDIFTVNRTKLSMVYSECIHFTLPFQHKLGYRQSYICLKLNTVTLGNLNVSRSKNKNTNCRSTFLFYNTSMYSVHTNGYSLFVKLWFGVY